MQNDNMTWFFGVVEDRNDPEEKGRVRVRVFGDHTEDKTKIPTESLPWAQVMMPVTSASIGGIGESATGIVQGSWVVGFYMDGDSRQSPLIMGTIPGDSKPTRNSVGFGDPDGVHPVRYGEPDTPYAARAVTFMSHASYISKQDTRVEQVETAVPPRVTSVSQDYNDSYYTRPTWDSPQHYEGFEPNYPYNKVTETESGHVFEIDDTPLNERISQYHKAGTNYEIQSDGTKHETIVKDNYTVIFGDDHVYIKGNANITVEGDLRQLVKGNYHLEVNGDKTELIRGSIQRKINNSEHAEIGFERAVNVGGDDKLRVSADQTIYVGKTRDATIGTTDDVYAGTSAMLATGGGLTLYGGASAALNSTNTIVSGSASLNLDSIAALNITCDNLMTINAATGPGGVLAVNAINGTVAFTSGDVVANNISLVTHTHTDTPGLGAGVTSPPNAV